MAHIYMINPTTFMLLKGIVQPKLNVMPLAYYPCATTSMEHIMIILYDEKYNMQQNFGEQVSKITLNKQIRNKSER